MTVRQPEIANGRPRQTESLAGCRRRAPARETKPTRVDVFARPVPRRSPGRGWGRACTEAFAGRPSRPRREPPFSTSSAVDAEEGQVLRDPPGCAAAVFHHRRRCCGRARGSSCTSCHKRREACCRRWLVVAVSVRALASICLCLPGADHHLADLVHCLKLDHIMPASACPCSGVVCPAAIVPCCI